MKSFFLTVLTIAVFASCKKQDSQTPMQTPERIIMDTPYASAARQKMDIYLPANRNETTPVVVLIHGGGWSEGNKSDLSSVIPDLKKLLPEYAFVNINYRLVYEGSNRFPTQEQDVKAAVEFVINNHQQLNISSKIVMVGFSAGAHLALLHSYKNDPGKNVAAIVDFYGPTDLPALWEAGIVQQFILTNVTGKFYADAKTLYEESSPVNYITDQSPPTIVFHGTEDQLVPGSQSTLLVDKLKEKNVTHEFTLYPGEAHGWVGDNLTDSIEKIKAFLKKHVQ